MIIPIYFCILLRFIGFFAKYRVIICISLLFIYIIIVNLINLDISLYLFTQSFSGEYVVNMDPFNQDTIMAESSSMGAAANSGGSMPPGFPGPESSDFSALSAAAAAKGKYVQHTDAQMQLT